MDKEKLRKLCLDSMKNIDFQVITLDGKDYCVFNRKQIKEFFKNSADTLWKGLMLTIEEANSNNKEDS